ncbi:MAG: CoA transferase [Gammaproteobacteria bacterium]|nr:CoA transferase [Gammaproteobacteria bacterium]
MSTALNGIRVLDLSRILAGPWASQLLGDYGADVVKIERPGSGDDTRQWGPPWLGGEGGESAYFLSTNRNKRSVTVDLKTDAGVDLVRKLALEADVVIENFKVGTLARFGIAAESLRASNPRLIFCSISTYGQHGSKAQMPGYDAMIQASGGLMSMTGAPKDENGGPQKVGVAIADIMTGMYAATAILAALAARERNGAGQIIDVPLYDSQVAWLANQNMNYLVGGIVPQRRGTAHPNIVPYQMFATADGHLMLAVGNDSQFRSCVACLGLSELADQPEFTSNASRVQNRHILVNKLDTAFAACTTADWLRVLTDAGVPCGPINDLHEVFTSDYVIERQLVLKQTHPLDNELPAVANPVKFSKTPVCYDKAPPLLGQHTAEVLREWLGYSAESIDSLRDAGAI